MRSPAAWTPRPSPIHRAIRGNHYLFLAIGVFSGVINVLALTGAFYMLQVYDRVLPSASLPTLVALTVLMSGLYVANGLLDSARVRLMSRIGVRIDNDLRDRVFAAIREIPLKTRGTGDGLEPVRDLDQIRHFFSGMGPVAVFDLPWIPVYMAVVFLLHPLLGLFATAGALLLVFLTVLTEQRTKRPMLSASRSGAERLAFGEEARRNAEAIRALGMGGRMQDRWEGLNTEHVSDQLRAADAAGSLGSMSKVLRLFLQSGILGLGAWLVLDGEVSAGAIIASSVVMSRALAPIETAITHWRSFLAARQAGRRLVETFDALQIGDPAPLVALPPPTRTLSVSGLTITPPGEQRPVVRNVSFALHAGDGLAVIGPSGAGKSSLVRALVGIWHPGVMGGVVRLDGASLNQWDPDHLGRYIGYLPQDVALLRGTIADNIARFDKAAASEAIVAAAQAAGAHDLIVEMPDGYQTRLGEQGHGLSAGQAQRVALARALYGDPFVVVLDEPNSNLDEAGEAALTRAIEGVRARRGVAIVVAHRPSALAALDTILMMSRGALVAFGPKTDVLKQVLQHAPIEVPRSPPAYPPPATATGLRVVIDREVTSDA